LSSARRDTGVSPIFVDRCAAGSTKDMQIGGPATLHAGGIDSFHAGAGRGGEALNADLEFPAGNRVGFLKTTSSVVGNQDGIINV
jgi:hypothetical protein